MREIISIAAAVGLICKAAYGSPASGAPPAAVITPAPVLHKRFDSNFVGYVLFDDGDSECTRLFEWLCKYDPALTYLPASVLTCRSDYTYTYTDGYGGCVESLGDLGTSCVGNTKVFTGGDTLEWSVSGPVDNCKACANICRSATACVTDYYYYSLEDIAPAWNIDCDTRSTGWTVLRMSSADLPTISALSDITSVDITTPPAEKTTVYITPSETSTSTTSSSSSSSSVPPTPGMLAILHVHLGSWN
jgi:hypothetical protein